MKVTAREIRLISDLGVTAASQAATAQQPEAIDRLQKTSAAGGPRTLAVAAPVELDTLWRAGRYAELVDRVAVDLEKMESTSIEAASFAWLGQATGQLYLMQHRLIGAANHLSPKQEPRPARKALELLQRVGDLLTTIFERTVALADAKEKSPVGPWQVFKNTMKQPGFHKTTETEAYFVEKLQKFVRKGGDIRDIQPVSAETLAKIKSGEPYEWVVDAFDVARIGPASGPATPGHTLLAWGQDVLAAGSVRFFKDPSGTIREAIVGTFSGHYRSNRDFVPHFARHLVAAGVAQEAIISQAGEAASPRGLEILYRALGGDGAELQERIEQLEAEAGRYNPDILAPLPQQPKAKPALGGVRPTSDAMRLCDAVFTMQQRTSSALRDGVLLEHGGEALGVARAIEDALILAEQAGDPSAFNEAMGLLQHLSNLEPSQIDSGARQVIETLHTRWKNHAFGTGVFDAAEVFGPRPSSGRRTRIVATLDPKVDEARLRSMIDAGISVARLNPAHGTIEELKATIKRVRKAAKDAGKEVLVQVDLPGPKIRLGKFANPSNLEFNDIWLKEGDTVTLTTADVLGTPKLLPVDFPSLAKDVKVGHRIFLNDGNVQLEVVAAQVKPDGTGVVEAKVRQGGKVWDRKGINLPDSSLSTGAVTAQDVAILDALLPDLDLVAVSFVGSAEDVLTARNEMAQRGRVVPVIAKIERREALENLRAIATVSDALMVARGDLGVEIGYEGVPAAERRINEIGNVLGKPTMVATEVLMSMVDNPTRPSRGDVEGLYSAVAEQGADSIMLAKETSFSKHPAQVIGAATRIIEQAEADKREAIYRDAMPPELLPTNVLGLMTAARS